MTRERPGITGADSKVVAYWVLCMTVRPNVRSSYTKDSIIRLKRSSL